MRKFVHDPTHNCDTNFRRLFPHVIHLSDGSFRVLWGCKHSILVDVWETDSAARMTELLSNVLSTRMVRGLMSRCDRGV